MRMLNLLLIAVSTILITPTLAHIGGPEACVNTEDWSRHGFRLKAIYYCQESLGGEEHKEVCLFDIVEGKEGFYVGYAVHAEPPQLPGISLQHYEPQHITRNDEKKLILQNKESGFWQGHNFKLEFNKKKLKASYKETSYNWIPFDNDQYGRTEYFRSNNLQCSAID